MMENKYDDPVFFEKYSQMDRSRKGLQGAGEWRTLERLLPDFRGKSVLDLGCGFGWHCEYAIEHGAASVTGVDISEKMLDRAKKGRYAAQINYIRSPLETFLFGRERFDVVISSLALHYIESFSALCSKIAACLSVGGKFVFSVEHPVFTAYGSQDWYYDASGKILHFPVDRYFEEGKREAVFLGEKVFKYHRTLTDYLETLVSCGFALEHLVEPQPPAEMVKELPGMADELRRPMMLIISCEKR